MNAVPVADPSQEEREPAAAGAGLSSTPSGKAWGGSRGKVASAKGSHTETLAWGGLQQGADSTEQQAGRGVAGGRDPEFQIARPDKSAKSELLQFQVLQEAGERWQMATPRGKTQQYDTCPAEI